MLPLHASRGGSYGKSHHCLHTHTHTLYCLHKYTHTHNALLHNYAHSTADKEASMIPVRAHCSGYIYVQHAHKHVHNQMCAQCANKHIVVVAGTQHTTHVYRGCLPRPPVYTRSKDKITKYQSYVCLTSFSMGELFFTTPSSYYSSYPNFHNQMGKSNGEMCSWIPMFYDQDVPSCPQHAPLLTTSRMRRKHSLVSASKSSHCFNTNTTPPSLRGPSHRDPVMRQ